MRKIIMFCLLVCTTMVITTGCDGIKEKSFIGTKWINEIYDEEIDDDSELDVYQNVIEFKKANKMEKCDEIKIYCSIYTWKVNGKYIEYYSGTDLVDKLELSDDGNSLKRIGEKRIYIKQK